MKAHLRLKNLTVELEVDNAKKLFEEVAQVSELFSEQCCGLCKSESIRPNVRVVGSGKQKFTYYELLCLSCHAHLNYGQLSDSGNLFPKRKLDAAGRPDMENGRYGDHQGWTKFRGDPAEEGESEPKPPEKNSPPPQARKR